MKYFWISLLVLGCSSMDNRHKMSDKAGLVRTRMPSYGSCKKLGVVVGQGSDFADLEIDAKNKASELGANYIDMAVPRGNMNGFFAKGMAFDCQAFREAADTIDD